VYKCLESVIHKLRFTMVGTQIDKLGSMGLLTDARFMWDIYQCVCYCIENF